LSQEEIRLSLPVLLVVTAGLVEEPSRLPLLNPLDVTEAPFLLSNVS
jgi:hypothetical protein